MNISDFYKYALQEGEGLGTAYEYYVKTSFINAFLKDKAVQKILIYGLPEKYGYSLDFFLYADKIGAKVDLIESRENKLHNLFRILGDNRMEMPNVVDSIKGHYDLVLSSEVLQSLLSSELAKLLHTLEKVGNNMILFVPNAYNKSHIKFSGLQGVIEEDLRIRDIISGFLDMPPFPPGVKKERKVKNHGLIRLLQYYADLEKHFPKNIKKRLSHIMYISG